MLRRARCLLAGCVAIGLTVWGLAAGGAEVKVAPPNGAPEYQALPRSTDGAQMALTVQKLERGFDPQRPLRIWAIGSSFTNGLGNGDPLIQSIRQRFPNAPKIVYKKIAGNSTSYHFSHGWARHLVIPDQPDVVLLYNFGKTEDLEKLIVELRRNTTADIVVGSLHWCKPHTSVWPDPEARNSHQDPVALRAMCARHGVEFVENRREMTEYMKANQLAIHDLLADSVHESRYAARMTVMNIARHFHHADRFAYDPSARERRVAVTSGEVTLDPGRWTAAQDGAARTASAQGSAVTVRFTGNRADLIGWRSPAGGTADLWIDGQPAGQVAAFEAGYVEPEKGNAKRPPNPPRDRCPHAVSLGANLVPQKWTLTMTSDACDYKLAGSVTGPDGEGNGLKPFTSRSGQILVDPDFWRDARHNRAGDRFTFEVVRTVAASVDFKAPASEKFRARLASNLANREHELKLVARGDGPVTVAAFDVFEPPEK